MKNRIPDKITFHADPDVVAQVEALADKHQIPVGAVINHVLKVAIDYLAEQRRSESEDDAFAA